MEQASMWKCDIGKRGKSTYILIVLFIVTENITQ